MQHGVLATKSNRSRQKNPDPSVESISSTLKIYDEEYDDIFRSLDEAIDRTTARLLAMDETPTKPPRHKGGLGSNLRHDAFSWESQGDAIDIQDLQAEGVQDQSAGTSKQAGFDVKDAPRKVFDSDDNKTLEEELVRIGRQSDSNKAAIEGILNKLTQQEKIAAEALHENLLKTVEEKRKVREGKEALSTLQENTLADTKENLAMLKTMKKVAKNTKEQNLFFELQLAEAIKQGAISRRIGFWSLGAGITAALTGIILIVIALWGVSANGATQKISDDQETSAPAPESSPSDVPTPAASLKASSAQ